MVVNEKLLGQNTRLGEANILVELQMNEIYSSYSKAKTILTFDEIVSFSLKRNCSMV